MNLAAAEGLPKTSEFDRALRQAAKYPNDQLLLSTLEYLFNDVVADPDPRLGGALAWVDQHSLILSGIVR